MTQPHDDPHAGSPVSTAGAPLTSARAVVVAVHGRGASPADILSLAPTLDRDDVAFLAPAAAGRTWYPHRFISDTAMNQPFLDSALKRILAVVEQAEAAGFTRKRIVLLGFSQGACLSGELIARHPQPWGGLVMFSGGLIGAPGTVWDTPGSLEGTPVFLGCSDVDAHIPKDRVEESAAVLTRMGGAVTMRIYEGMGHVVNRDEIEHARRILDAARA